MLHRADNLKQATAMVAVLLSLSSLAQNGGLYCHLGVCGSESVAIAAEESSCCHHDACSSSEHHASAHQETAFIGQHENHPHDSCPCPESCWCHQAPQPFELPRDPSEAFELELQAYVAISNELPLCNVAYQQELVAWSLLAESGEESVIHRCASLCRFLI